MNGDGLIHIDTPEALERFRKEHYLFVYSTALELTNSPNEAHRIAAQVFSNIGEHSHNRTLSKNCDMYLAAQVNLLFAQLNSRTQNTQVQTVKQQATTGGYESKRRVAQPVATSVAGNRLPRQNSPLQAQPITRQQSVPVAATQINQPVYTQPPQPVNNTVVNVPQQQNVASALQEAPKAEETVVIKEQRNTVAVPAQPVSVPGTVQPQTTVTIQFSGPSPSMESVTVSSDAAKENIQQFVPTTYTQQVKQAVRSAEDTAVDKVDYNPEETDMWTPDMDKNNKSSATETVENAGEKRASRWDDYIQAPNSQWKQKDSGKPILLFTLLNGILMIAAIISVAYALYKFGLLPKLF